MVEQWTSTIPSNRKIYQHFKLQPERLNYFRFELYWPLTVKLILRFRLASWLPRNDQNFKRNININMINQEKSYLCKCMHRCTNVHRICNLQPGLMDKLQGQSYLTHTTNNIILNSQLVLRKVFSTILFINHGVYIIVRCSCLQGRDRIGLRCVSISPYSKDALPASADKWVLALLLLGNVPTN